MSRVHIMSVGILAPGFEGWPSASLVLSGAREYLATPVAPRASPQLAAAERRRVSANARWALAVADEALTAATGMLRDHPASVFASADGDGDVLAQMLAALSAQPVTMSPTLFHNSVFNAPAGYCSIAQRLTGASTTVCAAEFTAGAALVEAHDQAVEDDLCVLCVVVDTTYPVALAGLRAPVPSFASALLLRCDVDAQVASMGSLSVRTSTAHTPIPDSAFGFCNDTAAGILPVLVAIARRQPARVVLAHHGGGSVVVDYLP